MMLSVLFNKDIVQLLPGTYTQPYNRHIAGTHRARETDKAASLQQAQVQTHATEGQRMEDTGLMK